MGWVLTEGINVLFIAHHSLISCPYHLSEILMELCWPLLTCHYQVLACMGIYRYYLKNLKKQILKITLNRAKYQSKPNFRKKSNPIISEVFVAWCDVLCSAVVS